MRCGGALRERSAVCRTNKVVSLARAAALTIRATRQGSLCPQPLHAPKAEPVHTLFVSSHGGPSPPFFPAVPHGALQDLLLSKPSVLPTTTPPTGLSLV